LSNIELALRIDQTIQVAAPRNYSEVFNGLIQVCGAYIAQYVGETNQTVTLEALKAEAAHFSEGLTEGLEFIFNAMKEKADALRDEDAQG
jgi:hypothetical protein